MLEKDTIENSAEEQDSDINDLKQSESQAENNDSQGETNAEDEFLAVKKELDEQKDKYLRLYADFENYKKRNAKERLEFLKLAGQEIIRDLLPVLDDFQRAEKAYGQDNNAENYVSGMKLISEKLQKTLQNKGLKAVESKGKDFNIEFHEAIAEVPAPSEDLKGKIIDEVESGYTLNDTVIRYAKVVVGK
ncbi:MAG: GrpE protein [Bacteroidota bacterium]|nr:GrpE protein [Bacteroidota bacterium]